MLPTTQKCGPLKQQGANIFLSWNIQTRHSAWCFYSWDGCLQLIWVHEICILWKQYYIKILSSCFTCYLLKSKLLVWDLFSGNAINQPATQMDIGHGEIQVVKLAYYYSTFQLVFILIETTFSLHSKSHEQNRVVKLFLTTAPCQAFPGGTHLLKCCWLCYSRTWIGSWYTIITHPLTSITTEKQKEAALDVPVFSTIWEGNN